MIVVSLPILIRRVSISCICILCCMEYFFVWHKTSIITETIHHYSNKENKPRASVVTQSNINNVTTHTDIQKQHQQQQQKLEFVHIPKTGGTAIEVIALGHNITWGMCHFTTNRKICGHLPDGMQYMDYPIEMCPHYGEWPGCAWWHMPPVYVLSSFPNHNPYGVDVDLFTVVRNPYERMISEYYYRNNIRAGKNAKNWESDEVKFNNEINKWLMHFSGNYFMHSGHMIPQYDFVYNNTNNVDDGSVFHTSNNTSTNTAATKKKKKKLIKNVLRFEFLGKEFQTLVELYNLPMVLPNQTMIGRASNNKVLGIHNLTNKNMVLIETIYQNDFLEFGYEILSPRI